MGTKKKKSGKSKRSPQNKGHYCRVCGEHKANEKFTGKGHATHICKSCTSKSPAQSSEDMTINKLYSMVFRHMSESEIKWLKNRRNDSRTEVSELAKKIFEERFPRQARNEIKAQLHIKNMSFRIRGEVFDNYGDEYVVNDEFITDTSGMIIKKTFRENETAIEEKSIKIGEKAIRKFFNVAVHNYDISFWDTDLCHEISYDPDINLLPEYRYSDNLDDLDDNESKQLGDDDGDALVEKIPTWSVEIKYKDGTEQTTKGYDYIPDPVMELFDDFDDYFVRRKIFRRRM